MRCTPPARPPDVTERLCIIDGHAQFFRAYYAIRGGLNSPVTNEPTNMVYGFCQMLLKLVRDGGCSHVALVIDASGRRPARA